MSAKHERGAAAGSLQSSDDIGSNFLDFLIFDLHSQFLELTAQVLRDLLLVARYTDDVCHVPGELSNPLPIHLLKHLFLHPFSSQPVVEYYSKFFVNIFCLLLTRTWLTVVADSLRFGRR